MKLKKTTTTTTQKQKQKTKQTNFQNSDEITNMEIKLLGLQYLLQAIRVVIVKIEKMKFCTEKSSHNATSKPPSTSNNSAMKQSHSTVSDSHSFIVPSFC